MRPLLAFNFPHLGETIVILIVGLLVFGKRLPDVARSLGKSIVEFKKGLKGVTEDVERESEPRPATPIAGPPTPPSLPGPGAPPAGTQAAEKPAV